MKLKTTDQKIWFTADTHFGHANILTFCPDTRKGMTVDEHDRFIIETWQEDVAPDDYVFILGDVSFVNEDRTLNILCQLPGKKILIKGNHDKTIINSSLLRAQFLYIKDYMSIVIDGHSIELFHYPIFEFNKQHRGAYHLYGHVHGKNIGMREGRSMDVGIDTRPGGDMKLWSWEEIHDILSKKPILNH